MTDAPAPRRIVDAHNHPDWHGHDFTRFLANMDERGIAKTWLLSWECPADEYDPGYGKAFGPLHGEGPISFARCAAYKERAPERFVLGYAPDPRRPGAADRLRAAVEIHDVRVCGEVKLRMTYDNPDALDLFRFCGEKGLPVVLHIDYPIDSGRSYPRPHYWYGGGIEALARALRACPKTSFLGHAPGFWAHISGDGRHNEEPYPDGPVRPGGRVPELLRAHPNLYGDLSAGSGFKALDRDREHARAFVLEFQDRLLYGRDFFDDRHRDLLLSLDLPPAALDKVFFENAERLTARAD